MYQLLLYGGLTVNLFDILTPYILPGRRWLSEELETAVRFQRSAVTSEENLQKSTLRC
jgi:hypothetical protein